MELREALAALRARWWLPILVALLGAGIAYGVCRLQGPRYQSSTTLFVAAAGSPITTDAVQGNQLAAARVASYARLITGPDLATELVAQLRLPMTPAQLSKEISASAEPDTVLIDVVVTDPDPRRAFNIAMAVATRFPLDAAQLETAAGNGAPVVISVAEPPQLPTEPSSPRTTRTVAIAGVLGLFVGAVAAMMRPVLDRSVRRPEHGADSARAPVIGLVPRDRSLRRARKGRLLDERTTSTAVSCRRLRAGLQFLDVGQAPTVLLLSSAVSSEGKTTVALRLGQALADAGHTVTVVEADLGAPSAARYLGLPEDRGLAQVLAGDAVLDDTLHRYDGGRLSVLPAGPAPPDAATALASGQISPLLEKLRGANDVVLVDGPPVLEATEAAELARSADGVLLVVRWGKTRRQQLRQAADILEFAHAHTLGVVLTRTPPTVQAGVWGPMPETVPGTEN